MQALSRKLAEELQTRFQALLVHDQSQPSGGSGEAGIGDVLGSLRGGLPPQAQPQAQPQPPAQPQAQPQTQLQAQRQTHAGPAAENVVRPVAFQREPEAPAPHRSRPGMSAAIETVLKATEMFKAAGEASEDKTRRALDLAFRTIAQLEKAEDRLRAAHGQIQELAAGADAARGAFARFAGVEAALAAAQARVLDLEGDAARLQAALAAADARAQQADSRAREAEELVAEAESGVRYLADKVSQVLGGRG